MYQMVKEHDMFWDPFIPKRFIDRCNFITSLGYITSIENNYHDLQPGLKVQPLENRGSVTAEGYY
jgi:hypothetical protein